MTQAESVSIRVITDTHIRSSLYTNLFSINLDISDVILKHCRHVDFRKLVFTENDEETRFPARSIPHNDQLLPNGCHLCRDKRERERENWERISHTEKNDHQEHRKQNTFILLWRLVVYLCISYSWHSSDNRNTTWITNLMEYRNSGAFSDHALQRSTIPTSLADGAATHHTQRTRLWICKLQSRDSCSGWPWIAKAKTKLLNYTVHRERRRRRRGRRCGLRQAGIWRNVLSGHSPAPPCMFSSAICVGKTKASGKSEQLVKCSLKQTKHEPTTVIFESHTMTS